jgi:hypothetical protein
LPNTHFPESFACSPQEKAVTSGRECCFRGCECLLDEDQSANAARSRGHDGSPSYPRNPGLCPDRGKDPLSNFAGPGLRRRVPFFASPAFTKPQVSGTAVTARGESSPARSANVARTGEGADCGATPALPLCGSTRQGKPSLRVAAPTRGGQPILNQRAVPYRELLFRYTNSTLGADRGGHIGGAAARERP